MLGNAKGEIVDVDALLKRGPVIVTFYHGFGRDIPAVNGALGEWALPVSATYLVDRDGTILYADTGFDYRDRAEPREVLEVLMQRAAAE